MTSSIKQSLLAKFLTPEMHQSLQGVKTKTCGFTIDDVIRSGKENPDSSVGIYAGDHESYSAFAPLFNEIIMAYHNYDESGKHKRNLNAKDLAVHDLDPEGEAILSSRIRVGRNLEGFALSPGISQQDRLKVENKIVDALLSLSGDLKGDYYPLSSMSEETRKQLIADHFLFKKGDRFLESAGANRDWPEGRGIFHSADKRFLVWVNEEDQLRIISMQSGGNLHEVFDRLARAITALETKLTFAYSDRLGYISSCPTNLGTAMRASFHMKLPHASQHPDFNETCAKLKLSIRGIHGEHSDSEGGVFDISNKQRLGISEVEAVQLLHDGAAHLLELDRQLAPKMEAESTLV
jgi:protein-arginine kinase